mmetsp:Transcript_14266/g.40957  ORF Transcript_14266/g.40957 Transcript_14266/m.40957 type:complete len:208 (+) Transcript_14266:4137-4760(+)
MGVAMRWASLRAVEGEKLRVKKKRSIVRRTWNWTYSDRAAVISAASRAVAISSEETADANSCPASMASVMACSAYLSKYHLMDVRPALPTWSNWKVRVVSPLGSSSRGPSSSESISTEGGSKIISLWSIYSRTWCHPTCLSSMDEAELDSRDWQSRMADSISELARWASSSIMAGRMVGAEGISAAVPRLSRTTTLDAPPTMSPFPA